MEVDSICEYNCFNNVVLRCSIKARLTIRNIAIPGLKVAINGLHKTHRGHESLETKSCHKLYYIAAARRHLCFVKRETSLLCPNGDAHSAFARATGHSVNSRLLTGLCIWILHDAPLTSTSRYQNQCLWSSPWRHGGISHSQGTPFLVRLIPPRLSHCGRRCYPPGLEWDKTGLSARHA